MELYDKKFVYFEWNDILEGKKCFLATNPTDLKMNVNCGCTDYYGEVEQKSDKNFPFRLKNSKSWANEGCFVYYDPSYEIKKAFYEDKTIQYKENGRWMDWKFKSLPSLSIDDCNDEWRIKPIEDEISNKNYFLNIYKCDYFRNFKISEFPTKNSIYGGTRKECEYVMNKICNDFINGCSVCKVKDCYKCERLKEFIKNIKFTRRMRNRELSEWLVKGNGEIMENNGFSSINWCYPIGKDNEEVNDRVRIREFGSDEWKEPLVEAK